MSIASFCSLATVIHEIGHVVGFWHEHSRPDRDQYITVHQENIRPGYKPDFDKITAVDSLGVPYDFKSIMHYSKVAFAKPGTMTITSIEKNIPFGGASVLSDLDILQTELLYNCSKLLIYDVGICTMHCYIMFLLESRSPLPSRLPAKVATPSPVTLPPGGCNRHLLNVTGQIFPPDSPYKSNTTCIWIIEVPKGYEVRLEIHDMELE